MFAGTPPLEALKMMMTLWCSYKVSKSGKPLKLGVYDITKAHLYGVAEREVYVTLPSDIPMEPNTCALLLRSSYGLQDAAGIWQKNYSELLGTDGWIRGIGYVAVFRRDDTGALLLVHGDDFAFTGFQSQTLC